MSEGLGVLLTPTGSLVLNHLVDSHAVAAQPNYCCLISYGTAGLNGTAVHEFRMTYASTSLSFDSFHIISRLKTNVILSMIDDSKFIFPAEPKAGSSSSVYRSWQTLCL